MRRRSFRQMLRTVHLWAGIVLGIPLIAIGLSGSALLLQREILRFSMPEASAIGETRPILEIVAAARPEAPPETRANWVQLPASPGAPAAVRFVTATRPARTTEVYVDPVSLEVLGTSDFVRRGPIGRVIADIHEFLMMPPEIGLPLVGWFAVALSFMCLSGLILWWPRKGRWLAAFLVRRGARGLRLHLDLHHAAGIWGLLVLLILSVSGIYLAFPQSFSAALKIALPDGPAGGGEPSDDIARIWPASPEQALTFAISAVPNARATGVQLPNADGGPFVVQMEDAGFGPSFPPITVAFDPNNEDIAYIDDPRTYSISDRVLNLQYALHLGVGLGWVWTVLVFLSGLLPLFLAVTGVTIWWKKRHARRLGAATVYAANENPDGAAIAPQSSPV